MIDHNRVVQNAEAEKSKKCGMCLAPSTLIHLNKIQTSHLQSRHLCSLISVGSKCGSSRTICQTTIEQTVSRGPRKTADRTMVKCGGAAETSSSLERIWHQDSCLSWLAQIYSHGQNCWDPWNVSRKSETYCINTCFCYTGLFSLCVLEQK